MRLRPGPSVIRMLQSRISPRQLFVDWRDHGLQDERSARSSRRNLSRRGAGAAATGDMARVRDWQFLVNAKPDNPPTIRDYKPAGTRDLALSCGRRRDDHLERKEGIPRVARLCHDLSRKIASLRLLCS